MPKKKLRSLSLPLQPGALSQPRPLPKALAFMQAVEKRVAEAQSPNEALHLVAQLDSLGRISSHGLAVALYAIEKRWETGWGDFQERSFTVQGYDSDTIRRYVGAGKFLHELPTKPLKESFLERPISDVIALAQHRNEHGDFSLPQLKELAEASDHADLREKLRGYANTRPKKGFLEIVLEADGTLTAWEAGQAEAFGYLNPDLLDGSLGARGRTRIIKRTRIQEK